MSTEPEHEYLRVEVTRTQRTEVYLKVPKGWRPTGRDYELLGRAAQETTHRSDWDDDGWEHDVNVGEHAVIAKEEAEEYRVYEVKPEVISP